MLPPLLTKTPREVLDFTWDWLDWLTPGEAIASSSFTASPAGLSIVSQASTATNATVWLAAGANQAAYQVANVITTSAGRTVDRSITVRIQQR